MEINSLDSLWNTRAEVNINTHFLIVIDILIVIIVFKCVLM